MSTRWDAAAAASAFLELFPDHGRNIYRSNPDGIRALAPELADDILTVDPPNSNDHLLQDTMFSLLRLLPEVVRQDAEQVFVGRVVTPTARAKAIAPSSEARIVLLHTGVSPMLALYALLFRKTFRFLAGLDRTGVATTGDVLVKARANMGALLDDPDVGVILDRRRRWNRQGVELVDEVLDVLQRVEERTAAGAFAHAELQDIAEQFVIAHEVGHHVLGHTHQLLFSPQRYPARRLVDEVRERLSLHAEPERNQSQRYEFDADLFAFSAVAGELAGRRFDRPLWYRAVHGACIALPALEDLELSSFAPQGTSAGQPTHPPMEDRFAHLAHLMLSFPKTDEDKDHPVGLLSQAMFFREVLAAARD